MIACETMKLSVYNELGYFSVANRRNDPNYAQVSGYINKDVALQFKVTCTAMEVSQTDALEEAVKLWLEKYEHPPTSDTNPKSSGSKGRGKIGGEE